MIQVQFKFNGGKCGICGDPFNQTHPRDNEDGGIYDAGIIVRSYHAGQVIYLRKFTLLIIMLLLDLLDTSNSIIDLLRLYTWKST